MNGTSGEPRQITRRDHNMGGRSAPMMMMMMMMQCRKYTADRTLAGVFVSNHRKLERSKLNRVATNEYDITTTGRRQCDGNMGCHRLPADVD